MLQSHGTYLSWEPAYLQVPSQNEKLPGRYGGVRTHNSGIRLAIPLGKSSLNWKLSSSSPSVALNSCLASVCLLKFIQRALSDYSCIVMRAKLKCIGILLHPMDVIGGVVLWMCFRAVQEEDPFTRFKMVVRWYLSGFYKKPKVSMP